MKTEIFPKIKTDTDVSRAQRHGVVPGQRRRAPSVSVPDRHNSLGLVKFLFPNDYDIYLHDTNREISLREEPPARRATAAFVSSTRTKLAEYVLGWQPDSVKYEMESGKNDHTVTLAQKLPVYIVYFTAYERDGQIHFADDVYRRDEGLKTRLSTAAP